MWPRTDTTRSQATIPFQITAAAIVAPSLTLGVAAAGKRNARAVPGLSVKFTLAGIAGKSAAPLPFSSNGASLAAFWANAERRSADLPANRSR